MSEHTQKTGTARPARPAGAAIAVDTVLLLAFAVSAFLLLDGSWPIAIVVAAEYAVLWWFMWRIAASSPGTLLLTQVFGWRRRPASGPEATATITEAVRDRGFANAVAGSGAAAFMSGLTPEATAQPQAQPQPQSPPQAQAQPPLQPQPHAQAQPQLQPQASAQSPQQRPQPLEDAQQPQSPPQAQPRPQQPHAQAKPVVLPSPVRGDEMTRNEPIPFTPASVPPRELLLPDGEVVPIGQTPLLIGRKPAPEHGEQPVQLDDDARSISRNHLAIGLIDGKPSAVDRGSANGTRILRDGQTRSLDPSTPWPLAPGDVLLLGRFELTVR